MTSERNSSSQEADSGRSTLPSSMRAVCALIRTTLSPTGRFACTGTPSDFQPDRSPTVDFLLAKKSIMFDSESERPLSPEEISWNALLTAYGFGWADEFDRTLIDGLHRGYFDPAAVCQQALLIHRR